jgi:hypothetical protein
MSFFLIVSFFLFSQWCEISYGDDSLPAGRESLIDKYHKIENELKKNPFEIPFYVESSVSNNVSYVDIYGTSQYPFDIVRNELQVPTNWCEIVLPHIYVRACTYKKVNGTWLLNIYNVNKISEPLDAAYQMKFVYRISKLQPKYVDIVLTAHEGSSYTKNHQFEFEAMPLEKNITFIHLRYSFGYSAWGYFLMQIFGGGKVGFSVIGTDSDGNPVYVGGLRGSVERNVVRYYLAILAYLDTLNIPAEQRFEKRINQWYALTGRYKRQLPEIDKEEYLTYKRHDQKSQQKLQSYLNR